MKESDYLAVETGPSAHRAACVGLLATLAVATAGMGCADVDGGGPSNVPSPIPNIEGRVVIEGEPVLGFTLEAEIIDDNDIGSVVAYEWSADEDVIEDATGDEYTLTEAEVGALITVSVRYTDAAGYLEVHTSTPTPPVARELNEPGTISISGVPSLGLTLTASLADGNGVSGAVVYQWASDGADIPSATGETYVLAPSDVDTMVTVSASYTDDAGYVESVTSDPVGPISATVTNVEGTVSLPNQILVGQGATAAIDDANGVSGAVDYQWRIDDVDIAGATMATYTPVKDDRGGRLSVVVSYTDDNGFMEGPITTVASDIVYSVIATDEASLLEAATTATTGDVIGIASPSAVGAYDAMAEIAFTAPMLLVQRTADSTAVISGQTCLVFGGTGTVVDGLVFDRLDWRQDSTCDSNGDGSVYLSGTGITVKNCEFLGEASPRTVPSSDPYHYMALKGVDNVIERNLFQEKDMDNEGSAITMFANTDEGVNQGHIIQYNLFKNMLGESGSSGNRDSGAHALQVGRTTGSDAQGDGLFVVQYNRFENVQSERRLMRVQSSRNVIRGNTVVNSLGLIALEDGFGSVVERNVILSEGIDNDDGGISFAPLGHTVVDNYVNNLRTTSGQRAGLLINIDPLDGSGNTAIRGTAGLDFTVVVARNTVVNAQRAITFDLDGTNCNGFPPTLDFDQNLVLNQSAETSINANDNGQGRRAVTDSDFVNSGCTLDPASDFDNNHFYSATLSQSGSFDFNGALADNVSGDEDGTTFTQDAAGLVNGADAAAGIGVDTSILIVIDETQVGPGSTWTAP